MNQIPIVPYDPKWPSYFEAESKRIRSALKKECVAIHHIGSTSVKGLTGKPIVDMIVETDNLNDAALLLESLGYNLKGELNIPFRPFFDKQENSHKYNLHLFEKGNPEIALNLLFRDYLREHKEEREEYGKLKLSLAPKIKEGRKTNAKVSEYTLEKDKFIKKILQKAGLKGLFVRFCTHHDEFDAAKDLRDKYFPGKLLNFSSKHFHHFMLYSATEIIGYAQVEVKQDQSGVLHIFALSEKGHAEFFINTILKWLAKIGVTEIKNNIH